MSAQVNGDWLTNGNGNWADETNWSSDPLIPGGATSTVNFTGVNITGNRNVLTDVDRTVGVMNIGDTNGSHAYILNGSGAPTLIFDNGGADAQLNLISTAGGNNAINNSLNIQLNDNLVISNTSNNRTLAIRSAIAGTANISISSTAGGNVNLEGDSTFIGTVTVDGPSSELFITRQEALGNAANGLVLSNGSRLTMSNNIFLGPQRTVSISGGAVIANSNGNSNTNTGNISGLIEGTGGLQIGGSNGSAAPIVLSNANTFTGGLTLGGGAVRFGSLENLGADTNITNDGGGLSFLGGNIDNLSAYSFTFTNNRLFTLDVVEADHEFEWDKVNDTNQNSASGTTFAKTGRGTVRVTAQQTYRNVQQAGTATTLNGGTLLIDYAAGGGLRGHDDGVGVGNGNTLRFAGGTLYLLGRGGADDTEQNLGDVKLASGGGSLVVDNQNGSGTTTANLGALGSFLSINPEFGSSLDLQAVNAGTGASVITTTDANTNGIVGQGRVTYNGQDFATNTDPGGSNQIGAFSGYVALPSSGASNTVNYQQSGSGTVTASQQVNTLKITGSNGDMLTIDPGQTLGIARSGLLYTGGSADTDNYSITGGSLAANDLVVHQQGTGSLTIDSVIANFAADQAATTTNGNNTVTVGSTADLAVGQVVTGANIRPGAPSIITAITSPTEFTISRTANGTGGTNLSFSSDLTKAGDGVLILTAANTYTGNTHINGGVLSISSDANLGTTSTAALKISGGTLRVTSGFTTTRNVEIGGNGATFDVADGETFSINDEIVGNYGTFILDNSDANGTGVLELNRQNRFSGGVEINSGTLRLGNDDALNGSGVNPLSFGGGSVATLQINGGRDVVVAGLNSANANAVVENGGGGDATLHVANGDDNTYDGVLQDGASGTLGLEKSGSGDLTLNGDNTFTGPTTVHNGTLFVNGDFASEVTVLEGGMLAGNGSFSSALTIADGGSLSPGNSPDIMTTSADLTFDTGSSFVFELIADTDTGRGTNFDGVDVSGPGVLDIDTGVTAEISFNADGSTVDFTSAFWDEGHQWQVFLNDNAPLLDSSEIFDLLAISTDSNGLDFSVTGGRLFWSTNGNDIFLNYVPEPTSGALLLGAVGLLALRRRHRR
ncbi:MAG: autotransporter-associated beta strand repeat-containing protein [Verrucomicrobiota bacterium]